MISADFGVHGDQLTSEVTASAGNFAHHQQNTLGLFDSSHISETTMGGLTELHQKTTHLGLDGINSAEAHTYVIPEIGTLASSGGIQLTGKDLVIDQNLNLFGLDCGCICRCSDMINYGSIGCNAFVEFINKASDCAAQAGGVICDLLDCVSQIIPG